MTKQTKISFGDSNTSRLEYYKGLKINSEDGIAFQGIKNPLEKKKSTGEDR